MTQAVRNNLDALVQINNVAKRYDGDPEVACGVAARSATRGAAIVLACGHWDRVDVSGVHAAALFTSWMQPSEALTAGRVAEAIDWAVRQFGVGGCAGRMAQEFGDHPETAAERMRWARRVAAAAPAWQASATWLMLPAAGTRTMGEVEIRIVLEVVEPPDGRLWVVRPGQAHHPGCEQGISFTGWLGLLRVLYEVSAEPGPRSYPGP